MFTLKNLVLFVLAICLSQQAFTQTAGTKWSITPSENFLAFSTQYKINNVWFPMLDVGYALSTQLSTHLAYGAFTTRQRRDNKVGVTGAVWSTYLSWRYKKSDAWHPFTLGGMSLLHLNPNYKDPNQSFAFTAGAGIEHTWAPHFSNSISLQDIYAIDGGKNNLLARFAIHAYL